MEISNGGTMENYSILEAAKILQVTDKTIRNYINRDFVKAEMWNGTWRIPHEDISELFRKKFGKSLDRISAETRREPSRILVEKSEFENQQQKVGKLAVIETREKELRAEIRNLNERNAQLEASSASGWTEARACQAELEKTREELHRARENEKRAQQDANWLRRERDETQMTAQRRAETIKRLREENQRLSDVLHQKALGVR